MTDIVDTIRAVHSILTERGANEGPLTVPLTDAADEIERLRAEVDRIRAGGCARDQRTTQYCAEAEALRGEIAILKNQIKCCEDCMEPTYAELLESRNALSRELCEWEDAYRHDQMADTWRKRYWVAKKLLDSMREAVDVAHEALRFAWGGEPLGSLEQEAMQKMGEALRGLTELKANEPRKP